MGADSTFAPRDAGIDLDAVDLSDPEFWAQPPAVRHAVFDALRRERPFAFFAEPESPVIESGPGYYAVTRYADLDAISSQPAQFCSGRGAVSIQYLARREIGVAFKTLFDRLPDLKVSGEPDRLRSSFINGLKHLPATLTGAR